MTGTLILSVEPVWPPVSGGDLRSCGIAAAAAKIGPVRILSVIHTPGAGAEPDSRVTLGALSEAQIADVKRRPKGGSGIDVTLPKDAEARLAKELATLQPDAVIVENLALHPFLPTIRRTKSRLILDLHNVDSDLVAQLVVGWHRACGWPIWKAMKVRAIERRVCECVDEVWACSRIDAARIAAIAGSKVDPHVVPNGIPHFETAPRALPARDRRTTGPVLLFVGHLGYRPNIVAARILANSILPAVRARLPGTRLILAGRTPTPAVSELAGDGIAVVASPPDVTDLLLEADFAVVPLTMGGGTRIKIIEAMAWGVPVVATRRAAEGLDLVDGVHVRIAERADAFASAIVALWHDPKAYAAQRAAGHHISNERFGAEAIERAVAEGLASPRRSGSS